MGVQWFVFDFVVGEGYLVIQYDYYQDGDVEEDVLVVVGVLFFDGEQGQFFQDVVFLVVFFVFVYVGGDGRRWCSRWWGGWGR